MPPSAETFISRWNGTEPPPPSTRGLGDYRFERAVMRHEPDGTTSNRRIAPPSAKPTKPRTALFTPNHRPGLLRRWRMAQELIRPTHPGIHYDFC